MLLPFLTEGEIEVARKWRECVGRFVKIYRESISHDPNDSEIARHMEFQMWHDVVSWVNSVDHHRADALARKGIWLTKPTSANMYHWVSTEIIGTPFVLDTIKAITQTTSKMIIPRIRKFCQ